MIKILIKRTYVIKTIVIKILIKPSIRAYHRELWNIIVEC